MRARSLVIFPDSTVSTQAASNFWVNSQSLSSLSNLALLANEHCHKAFQRHINPNKKGDLIWQRLVYIPVSKPPRPSKYWSNAVGAGFTTLLVNSEVASYCSMSSFSFDSLAIRAYLKESLQFSIHHNHSFYLSPSIFNSKCYSSVCWCHPCCTKIILMIS